MENSFVKRLRKQDVREILSKLGLRIAEELPKPYCKGKNEDGTYGMLVKCERLNQEKMCDVPFFNKSMPDKANEILALPLLVGTYSHSYFDDDKYILIDIGEFHMTELACMFFTEEEKNFFSLMMEVYIEYMLRKFGKEYSKALEEYLNSTTIDEQNASEQNIEI